MADTDLSEVQNLLLIRCLMGRALFEKEDWEKVKRVLTDVDVSQDGAECVGAECVLMLAEAHYHLGELVEGYGVIEEHRGLLDAFACKERATLEFLLCFEMCWWSRCAQVFAAAFPGAGIWTSDEGLDLMERVMTDMEGVTGDGASYCGLCFRRKKTLLQFNLKSTRSHWVGKSVWEWIAKDDEIFHPGSAGARSAKKLVSKSFFFCSQSKATGERPKVAGSLNCESDILQEPEGAYENYICQEGLEREELDPQGHKDLLRGVASVCYRQILHYVGEFLVGKDETSAADVRHAIFGLPGNRRHSLAAHAWLATLGVGEVDVDVFRYQDDANPEAFRFPNLTLEIDRGMSQMSEPPTALAHLSANNVHMMVSSPHPPSENPKSYSNFCGRLGSTLADATDDQVQNDPVVGPLLRQSQEVFRRATGSIDYGSDRSAFSLAVEPEWVSLLPSGFHSSGTPPVPYEYDFQHKKWDTSTEDGEPLCFVHGLVYYSLFLTRDQSVPDSKANLVVAQNQSAMFLNAYYFYMCEGKLVTEHCNKRFLGLKLRGDDGSPAQDLVARVEAGDIHPNMRVTLAAFAKRRRSWTPPAARTSTPIKCDGCEQTLDPSEFSKRQRKKAEKGKPAKCKSCVAQDDQEASSSSAPKPAPP